MRRRWLAGVWLAAALGAGPVGAADLPDLEDPKVQYEVGMSHLSVKAGDARDPAEAVVWLRKAALRGHADAQSQLGICYQQGLGVERDPAQALAWFQRAAEQGNARGQLQMSLAYRSGQGVARDAGKAMAYLQQAAENGHPKARLDLGMAYRDGVGVAPDPVQAAFWLVLASEAGSPAARFMTAGARRKLGPEQVADLEQRLATFRRDHPTAPPAGDARAAAP